MAVGLQTLPGSWWYPAFVSNESRSVRAPIIQLIWGNSSMLCKRLSVAMVRNPWRPPPTQLPTTPFIKLLHRNFRVQPQKRRKRGRRRGRIRIREREIQHSWGVGRTDERSLVFYGRNPGGTAGKVSRQTGEVLDRSITAEGCKTQPARDVLWLVITQHTRTTMLF